MCTSFHNNPARPLQSQFPQHRRRIALYELNPFPKVKGRMRSWPFRTSGVISFHVSWFWLDIGTQESFLETINLQTPSLGSLRPYWLPRRHKRAKTCGGEGEEEKPGLPKPRIPGKRPWSPTHASRYPCFPAHPRLPWLHSRKQKTRG